MTPEEFANLFNDARGLIGSANAAALSQMIERLLSTLVPVTWEWLEQNAVAQNRAAELRFLRSQIFGTKSEKAQYVEAAREEAQKAAGIDDDEEYENACEIGSKPAAPSPSEILDSQRIVNSSNPEQESPSRVLDQGGKPEETSAANSSTSQGSKASAQTGGSKTNTAGASETSGGRPRKKGDRNPHNKKARDKAKATERASKSPDSKTTEFGPEVPREEVHHEIPKGLYCIHCRGQVVSLGKSKVAKEIDVSESVLVLRTHHLHKGECANGCMTFVASRPIRAVIGMNFSPSFAAKVIVDKFLGHIPINRQSALLNLQGAKISRHRLNNLVLSTWMVLEFLVKRIREENQKQPNLSCDESPVRVVINFEKKMRYLWCLTSNKAVSFTVTTHRNRQVARDIIGEYPGTITSDRHAIYIDLIVNKPQNGCLAHSRRYFYYAIDSDEVLAMKFLVLIGKLYEVECRSKQCNQSHHERKLLRQQHSKLIFDAMWDLAMQATVVPRTPMAKAIKYMVKHWRALTYSLEDGAVEIDNNVTERQLRGPKLGWKNWLQPQSETGIAAVAGFYTIVHTCRLHSINPREYLKDVITKINNDWPASRIDELLPWNWRKNSHPEINPPKVTRVLAQPNIAKIAG